MDTLTTIGVKFSAHGHEYLIECVFTNVNSRLPSHCWHFNEPVRVLEVHGPNIETVEPPSFVQGETDEFPERLKKAIDSVRKT